MRGNWGSWDGSPLLLWSFCPCESPSHLLPMSWGLGTCCSLCPSHLSSHGLLPALWPGPPLGLCQPSKLGRSLFCRLLEHPIFFLCSISQNSHHLANDLFHFHLFVSTKPPTPRIPLGEYSKDVCSSTGSPPNESDHSPWASGERAGPPYFSWLCRLFPL